MNCLVIPVAHECEREYWHEIESSVLKNSNEFNVLEIHFSSLFILTRKAFAHFLPLALYPLLLCTTCGLEDRLYDILDKTNGRIPSEIPEPLVRPSINLLQLVLASEHLFELTVDSSARQGQVRKAMLIRMQKALEARA
ncbi:MAG: hypothetical protein J0L72_07745 [Armatimonadetes bacterium]|nr:hypothetical protein [Armatimonadota bacterium]